MAINTSIPTFPSLTPPIASGIGTLRSLSLFWGGSNYINPDSGDTGGSLIETVSGPAASTYTTALTYTGSGYLEWLGWWGLYNATPGTVEVKLTVDGLLVINGASAAAKSLVCAVGSANRVSALDIAGAAGVSLNCAPGRMPFRNSILIEHKYTTASGGQVGYKLVKTG